MGMIDDVIELAHTEGLVRSTTLGPDGCDGYDISASPGPITVWVRPDGRFSRATADGELITLGQVMKGLVAATIPQTPTLSGVTHSGR